MLKKSFSFAPLNATFGRVLERVLLIAHSLKRGSHASFRALIRLIYPPQSYDHLISDQPDRPQTFPASSGLSAHLWQKISFYTDKKSCDRCALVFDQQIYVDTNHICEACAQEAIEKEVLIEKLRCVMVYDEASSGLVLAFKHGDRPDLVRLFLPWLMAALKDIEAEIDLIVPVPLHPSRLWARRYNQAAEMARGLSTALMRDYSAHGLRRIKATKPQSGDKKARQKNILPGYFSLSPKGAMAVRGRCVLLVDDVYTTGTTLKACAKVLRKSGARKVFAVVLARAIDRSRL